MLENIKKFLYWALILGVLGRGNPLGLSAGGRGVMVISPIKRIKGALESSLF